MKALYKIALVVSVSAAFTSCFNKREPNYQYMPNMYQSVAYEPYAEASAFPSGKEGQIPAEGSIPRGFVPYELPDTNEGYEASKSNTSPLADEAYDEARAGELYTIYCAICHGDKGDGQGNLVKREKFLGVPNYKERDITEGSVYHVATYGKNMMGSYANQLSQEERWEVSRYVMQLRSKL